MSLVWLIVRKDFRRIVGPLGLWLLLLLLHTLFVIIWTGPDGTTVAEHQGRRYFVNACGAVVMGVGFILAAWLVMEDNLVSNRSFWRSRPISGVRLLAAKLLGALVFFGVVPVLVLAPVWLGCGFSLAEFAPAALEFIATQFACSLAALALGSVTESSGQFLVRLTIGFLALPLLGVYAAGALPIGDGVSEALQASRSALVSVLAGLIPLTMFVHQFLTRRTGRTWLIFALGLGVTILVGRAWPWNYLGESAAPPHGGIPAGSPQFTALRLTAAPLNSLGNRVPLRLEGKVTGIAPGEHARLDRVKTWWQEGDTVTTGPRFTGLVTNGQPDTEVVRQLAGLKATPDGETEWSASSRETEQTLKKLQRSGGRLLGQVRASVLHGAVLGELPLRVGATLKVGSSLTRVTELKWADGKLVVQIEERDVWSLADAGLYSNSYDAARRRTRPREDRFVVLNRALAVEQVPAIEEVGTIKANSFLVGRRNLVIAPPAQPSEAVEKTSGWLEGAVLVKVRFRPVRQITQSLSGEGVQLTP